MSPTEKRVGKVTYWRGAHCPTFTTHKLAEIPGISRRHARRILERGPLVARRRFFKKPQGVNSIDINYGPSFGLKIGPRFFIPIV